MYLSRGEIAALKKGIIRRYLDQFYFSEDSHSTPNRNEKENDDQRVSNHFSRVPMENVQLN